MSVHVAITRTVKEGCEAEFEERLMRFAQRSLNFPGTRGLQLLRPTPDSGSREYGIMRTFASAADREAFYRSPLFSEWQAEVAPLVEGEMKNRDLHGLEAWFRNPELPRPPRWKMALATLLGVYPTSLLLSIFVAPHIHHLPRGVSSLIFAACMVLILTWAIMPLVTKLLRRWLHPHP